jgi:hypothetical protein
VDIFVDKILVSTVYHKYCHFIFKEKANRGGKLVWFVEIERKAAKLSITFTYRSSS